MPDNNIHPLNNDLSKLSIAQIEQKLSELRTKYFRAKNPQLRQQLNFFIIDFNEELKTRVAKEQAKLAKESGKDLDNLINID
tara:strand:- start:7568 stop:7813 length:246 start_codon:yes stop_codon:yes gene_type:complete